MLGLVYLQLKPGSSQETLSERIQKGDEKPVRSPRPNSRPSRPPIYGRDYGFKLSAWINLNLLGHYGIRLKVQGIKTQKLKTLPTQAMNTRI